MKKILFICKYNRFRSRVAEAYFNKINKNKSIKAESAGIVRGSALNKKQIAVAKKELGIDISGKPRSLTTKLLKWQDIIVIVADDVPPALFKENKKYGKKLIEWKIKDSLNSIKSIVTKVNKLVRTLNQNDV